MILGGFPQHEIIHPWLLVMLPGGTCKSRAKNNVHILPVDWKILARIWRNPMKCNRPHLVCITYSHWTTEFKQFNWLTKIFLIKTCGCDYLWRHHSYLVLDMSEHLYKVHHFFILLLPLCRMCQCDMVIQYAIHTEGYQENSNERLTTTSGNNHKCHLFTILWDLYIFKL